MIDNNKGMIDNHDKLPISDPPIKVKVRNEYLLETREVIIEGDLVVAETIADVRNLSQEYIDALKSGKLKGVQVLGYYHKGDTPAPIEYYLSDTLAEDDGGSVFEVGGIKLEHKFIGDVDVRYFGAKEGEYIDSYFNKAKDVVESLVLDQHYLQNNTLIITKSNFNLNITSNGQLYIDETKDGNAISINPYLTNISIHGSGTIKGSTDDDTVGYAISVGRESSDVRIEGLRLDGFTGGIILQFKNRNIKMIGNSFYNMTFVPRVDAGGYGIVYQESYNTITTENYFDSTVYRHHIYYASNTILSDPNDLGSDHILSNNTFKLESSSTYVSGNEFSVKVLQTKNVTCVGNVLSGGVGGFWLTGVCENVNIVGNVITGIRKGNSSTASAIGAHGSDTFLTNINISDNIIQDCQSARGDFDIIRIFNSNISNNIIMAYGSAGTTTNGIYIDVTCQDLKINNNTIKGHQRGINILKNSALTELETRDVYVLDNVIETLNFGFFTSSSIFTKGLKISGNSIVTTVLNNIYIGSNIDEVVIDNNKLKAIANTPTLNITNVHTYNLFFYDNVILSTNRTNTVANAGTGYVFQPLGSRNVKTTLTALPTSSTYTWVTGDVIESANTSVSGWLRITTGTSNVLGTDWRLIFRDASTSLKGVVNQSANVADITTADATDLATALVLVNELKSKLNAKLSVDKSSGQQATA